MIGNSVEKAVEVLKKGGVIATPTEAVYGLSADPDCIPAIKQILALKAREAHKGFILVADSLEKLSPYIAPLNETQRATLSASWPGPITWVVPSAKGLSALLSGGRNTIAVRVSAHPLLRELCASFGKPLVSTSANLATFPPAKTAQQVEAIFGNTPLGYILEGSLGTENKPTQIRDLSSGHILRE